MEFSYFPELFPDELLYSACARFQSSMGNRARKSHIQKLFDTLSCCAVTDLPSHLETLADKMKYGDVTVESLILNHTMFPYYRPFLPKVTAQKVWGYMISKTQGSKIHMSLGINSTSVPKPRYLRFCVKCVEKDFNHYGITYWRRIHQIPGVNLCPTHDYYLINSNVLISTQRGKHHFVDLSNVYRTSETADCETLGAERLLNIARLSAELLNSEYDKTICKDTLRDFYLEQLDLRGYVTGKKRVRFKLLIADFTEYHSHSFLNYLNSHIEEGVEDTWLHKAIRSSPDNCHPMRHLLLLEFFGTHLGNLARSTKTKPFGVPPWPCLNKAAIHYKEPVIRECIVSTGSKTKKPTGHFSCYCGFEYIRTGPDVSVEDRYKRGRIQSFGSVWLLAAQEINKELGLSLREKARRLGVDPKTFLKMTTRPADEIKRDIKDQRMPTRKIVTKRHVISIRAVRVDWQERDREMSEHVIKAVTKLMLHEKPIRITRSEIIRAAELHSSITRYAKKLPLTSSMINRFVESLEEFQIRRIDWAIHQLRDRGELIEWKIRRLAAITKKCSSKVQDYLKNSLD